MSSIDRPISPPRRKRPRAASEDVSLPPAKTNVTSRQEVQHESSTGSSDEIQIVPSSIRLYSIKDLPASENVDTITLNDILSPQSTLDELWSFNYMTYMDFLRDAIGHKDEKRVKIRVVHGYWRQEDESRKFMEMGVWGDNVKLISSYLPDTYGTHHSKILVLFRTDDTAQVVVHTANMIPFDHENMTNAVYITPHLPLKSSDTPVSPFETSLLEYFSFYSPSRTRELVSRLKKFDFTSVKAHFIASVPGKFVGPEAKKWGLGRLRKVLKDVESHSNTELFAQFSSVGSFGKKDNWLGPQLHTTLAVSRSSHLQPPLRLIYPTLKNVQDSLNGYRSGSSIHWSITSPAHEDQEKYMKPALRQWRSLTAGRERAAPHIKTYGRVTKTGILDWFLLTSANLSKPAWGATEGKPPNDGLRIRSYEAGVLIEPGLWGKWTVLVPTYKSDWPTEEQVKWAKEKGYKTIVAVRMAWDLPMIGYSQGDVPWVRNREYDGTDWLGISWP